MPYTEKITFIASYSVKQVGVGEKVWHYPSDVLAGAAIGAGCAVVNIYVNKWLNKWLFGE